MIGLKDSRQFFNQWESKPKPIAPCTRDFSRASSELQVIARNCDWFMGVIALVLVFRQSFENHSKQVLQIEFADCCLLRWSSTCLVFYLDHYRTRKFPTKPSKNKLEVALCFLVFCLLEWRKWGSPIGFFYPAIPTRISPQSRNPDGFYRLISIPSQQTQGLTIRFN